MADVFARSTMNFGGAFAADRGIIAAPANTSFGILMQNIQIQYGQQVTRIYDLGQYNNPANVFYVAGRAQGTLACGHIVGPSAAVSRFHADFGNVCRAASNTVGLELAGVGCGVRENRTLTDQTHERRDSDVNLRGKKAIYHARFCVLMQMGMQVDAQNLLINENSQMQFASLEHRLEDLPTGPLGRLFNAATGPLQALSQALAAGGGGGGAGGRTPTAEPTR